MNENTAEAVERLRKSWTGPMTEPQLAFLRDAQGFIEFAIRNGLTFPMVVAALLSDLNDIARDGFDYEKAQSRGFQPKVTGYHELSTAEFGESDEVEPLN